MWKQVAACAAAGQSHGFGERVLQPIRRFRRRSLSFGKSRIARWRTTGAKRPGVRQWRLPLFRSAARDMFGNQMLDASTGTGV
jgi:hypothetical protein